MGAFLLTLLCASAPLEAQPLAQRYPEDVGIAADPAVLFADNFDSGIGAWSSVSDQAALESEPAVVHRGGGALRITATKGQNTGGDVALKMDPGHEQVFLRFYTRFHPDTIMPHHFVKLQALKPGFWGDAGQKPPGDMGFWTGIEPTKERIWHFYSYWHEMHSWQTVEGLPDGRDNPYYGNGFTPDGQTSLAMDSWICVEVMLKANTVGQHDGEQAFWIEDQLVGDYRTGSPAAGHWIRDGFITSGTYFKPEQAGPFEGYNWRTDPSLKINQAILRWYQSEEHIKDSPTQEHIVYFDDVVIATERIGCRRAAPTGDSGPTAPDGGVKDGAPDSATVPAADRGASIADSAGERESRAVSDGCSTAGGAGGSWSLVLVLLLAGLFWPRGKRFRWGKNWFGYLVCRSCRLRSSRRW